MRLLVANFFPAFHPPRSGGEQRYHFFYRHLSRHCDVTLLSPTFANRTLEEVRFSPTFRELRVPKHESFDRLHGDLDAKGIGPECSAYVVALGSALESEYASRFASAAIDADVIIHESPFTLPYDRSFGIDGKPRIYNAYNVEHRLAAQILEGEEGAKASGFIRFLERTLATHAALIFTTSEEDRQLLAADFEIPLEDIALAPNGFEPPDELSQPRTSAERDGSRAVFVGSAHPPNVEAARYIAEFLAPALNAVEFRIIGAVCDKLNRRAPPNVKLLGLVDDAIKRRELDRCAVAINPMFSGSGTNLKVLDYLAAGAPVVASRVGARGLSLEDGVTAFICDPEDFVDRLRGVLADAPLRSRVANAGRSKVFAEFTWASIADRAYRSITHRLSSRHTAGSATRRRPLLLHVNDFAVAEAVGGGEARIRELTIELGRQFDVVVLCLTHEMRPAYRRIAAHVLEVRIPKTVEHRDAEIHAARGEKVSINDLVAAKFCIDNSDFVSTFRLIAASASAVIFEHPYLSALIPWVPADIPVVYSSLNVERALKAELLSARRDGASRLLEVRELERRMLERADLVVCVSEQDRQDFSTDFPDLRYAVIENGVRSTRRDLAGLPACMAPRGRLLGIFIGSAHPPNAEAARFLIEVLAPAIPELDVVLVGSVCSAVGPVPKAANVHMVGVLGEAEKNALLARADVALNPLFGGGGSSLKVPDFFASALPLVSTRTGVRGYAVQDGEHYVEADRKTFVDRTRQLLEDDELRERLGRTARRYAEQAIDWRVLGQRYRRAVSELIGAMPKPRVLVVTYRFADPPPGGAETFLVNILKELDRRGNVSVDVATCDVDTIADIWHFSARYASTKAGHRVPAYVDTVLRFPVEHVSDVELQQCRRLFQVWMRETREQALALRSSDRGTTLLGGWNFPERHGDHVRRWTSRESHLEVDPAAIGIRLGGYAPRSTRVEVRKCGHPIASRMVSGRFEWEFDPGRGDNVLALFVEDAYESDGDPRDLGIVIDDIAVDDGSGWRTVALDADFETAARRSDRGRWVRSLIDITNRRDRADDDLFFAVRGPRSPALETWLDANMATYDVVLAQGTPFATPAIATEIAARHGIPVVLLPHFHMEDRYYHWLRYYEMFRRARRVIAAPQSVKSTFFDAIGASSVALPGGGVDAGEFTQTSLVHAGAAFRALHGGTKPFVLVLGRKTGAKNYRLAVDAVAALNRQEHRLDLVLVGPDEDRRAVTEPHTFCYGAQRRDVVVGALARALCLVNMSDSESFGIVLLESWLAGRPVIARRDCAAFSDIVISGENGFLVNGASDLAQAIETYLLGPAIAIEHARNGRAVAERYAWHRLAGQIEAVLLDACGAVQPREMKHEHA